MMINKAQDISIDTYNYPLPDEKIAKFPLQKRDGSKLLTYQSGTISEDRFHNISHYIPEGSLMVFNNTKVVQARLSFQKETGALIEIFCLEPHAPNDYTLAFQERKSCIWLCMIGNAKKWKVGKLLLGDSEITAEKVESFGETSLVRFEWKDETRTFADILDLYGELPIPPYLNRKTEECDKETYQTIYSRIKGSVAAPTAGLHFTSTVFDRLKEKHVIRTEVTLHVGAGTFKPVKTDTIGMHEMHTELISVGKETIKQIRDSLQLVVAVGTTSVRTLESLYYIGVRLEQNPHPETLDVSQWMPYKEDNNQISTIQALDNILNYLTNQDIDVLTAHTRIMIVPGYKFKIVNSIITNFHQPKSTLLLLIAAFVGDNWKNIYEHALANDFRFLSYGDSSILFR